MSTMTGCAAIVNGVNQPIAVETRLNGDPLAGAACTLSSNKGIWFVNTPGSLVVHRGYQDLVVECTKDGLTPAIASIASTTKAMAFGNILFGGAIGVGVDVGTGAAYDYPALISIEMGSGRVPIGLPPVVLESMPSPVRPVVAPVVAPSSIAATNPYAAPSGPSQPAPMGRENKYQISAETFAKSQSCAARPEAVLSAFGPGSETYTIACGSGESLIARCEYGNCRALK